MSDFSNKDRGIDAGARTTERGAAKSSAPKSASSAAREVIEQFNPKSVAEGREYGGALYRQAGSRKTQYVKTPNVQPPGRGTGHVSTKQAIPEGAVEAGRWHTHGRTENYTDEDFSNDDLRLAHARGLPSWLGTPKGAVKVAIPVESGFVILDVVTAEGTRPNIRTVPVPD